MSSTKSYKDYVLDQLKFMDNIKCRLMMGEYILYSNNIIIGGIYDKQLLIKCTKNNSAFDLPTAIPYPTAKPMNYIEDIVDVERLQSIMKTTYNDLS